jgi:putative permease
VVLSSVFIPKLSDQVSDLQAEVPKYVSLVNNLLKNNSSKINKVLSQFSKLNVTDEAVHWAEKQAASAMTALPDMVSTALSTMILAPFFAFFMLQDGRGFVHKLLSLVPNNLFELALNLQFQMNQQLGGFIRARFLESALVGGIVWVGLIIINFPYALFLGIVAGITNIIPYIGPIIGAAPAIIIALAAEKTPLYLAVVAAIYVLAQVLDMLLVIPLVVAKIVDLHPVMVVVVIIIGGQVMGILGMIISIPVASILKLTFTEFYNHVVDFRS